MVEVDGETGVKKRPRLVTDLPGDISDGCDSLPELSYECPETTADWDTG